MEDFEIIDLYWRREERAIEETDMKYGRFCRKIALDILSNEQDMQECVNDTYLNVWNAIPPQKPECFRTWLGRIIRNVSLNQWNKQHAAKRGGVHPIILELEECIPARQTVELQLEEKVIGTVISTWLRTLKKEDRVLFVQRYWNGMSSDEMAKELKIPANRLSKKMYGLRQKLKRALEEAEVFL